MEALVLAAGKGTRMKSSRPKVLHKIFGRPVLAYVLDTLNRVGVKKPKVVIGHGADQVRKALGDRAVWILQKEQKGTGHAVQCAERFLKNAKDDLLIWPGDMPLLEYETLKKFRQEHLQARADVSVLSSLQVHPAGYGRILRAGGKFYAIREELDASENERRIQEVNTGVYLFRAGALFKALRQVRPTNQKQEYYLTDTIEVLDAQGGRLYAFPFAGLHEGRGINSRKDLSDVTQKMNSREIRNHEANGVTFVAPDQTFVAPGVKIGRDTVIYPWTFIEKGVKIGEDCEVGPFAKIRSGSVIGDGSVVGSFVEVTRTQIGKKVMAKHLSYLGDAVIGDGCNVGAGTITANFDGKNKHRTRVGKRVLLGSDTVLVAPVSVGDNARTGAGSVVTGGTKVKKGDTYVGVPARPMNTSRKRRKK